MPMVNGKKYPYTKQGKAAAAKAKKTDKVKKAEGGMLSKVKNTQNEDIKDASDAKPAFRTPLPFMCGGGAYKTNSSSKSKKSKSNMRKAEGGPVQKVMKDKPVNNKERDNPEQEDIRYSRNRNNNNNKSNGNGNGRKN
jgi:hypothetical protein